MSKRLPKNENGLGDVEWAVSWGRRCFRFREGLVWAALGIFAVVRPDGAPLPAVLLLVLLGAALRVWAAASAGEHTRAKSDRVPVLVTHGPFAVTRNPIYLANLMIVASTFVAAGRWVGAVLAMLLFASAYWLIVRYEEANLRKIFGERYAEYCRSTPRWLPRRLPRGHPFPWRQGLWRERFSLVTYATFVAVYVVTDGLR